VARSSLSDEEVQLRKRARRRLVGAVALVILIVALAPLILDRAPKSSTQHIDVQMPAAGGASGDASTVGGTSSAGAMQAPGGDGAAGMQAAAEPPAAVQGAGATPAASARGPGSEPSAATASPAQALPAATPSNQGPPPVVPAPNEGPPAAPPPPETPAHTGEPAHASAEGYVVPIIATVSVDKARALKQKLQKAKLPAYLEKTPDGGKTRVRVGPFKHKDAAERARQRLTKLGFDPGKVVPKGE
jgi:DedD protein